MSRLRVDRALISVSNKTGLAEFVEKLVAHGVEIVCSGGTAAHLEDAGIVVLHVEDVKHVSLGHA